MLPGHLIDDFWSEVAKELSPNDPARAREEIRLMRGSWCEATLQALLSGNIFGAGLDGSANTRGRPWTSRSPT
jgi:hypothetical protein